MRGSILLAGVLALCLILLPGCSAGEKQGQSAALGPNDVRPTPVTFEGAGGWKLHGALYRPAAPSGGAVLCHPMLSQTQATYASLAQALAARGLIVLAYDPRGHGESTTGMDGQPRPGWKEHLENAPPDLEFWAGLVDDLARAKAFLGSQKDVAAGRIAVVGASVGGNAALALGVQDPTLAAVVLLSPGEKYRGIATFENAAKLTRPLYVALGEGDKDAGTAPAAIFAKAVKLADQDKVLKRFPGAAHGTKLLEEYPQLAGELADWIAARVAPAK